VPWQRSTWQPLPPTLSAELKFLLIWLGLTPATASLPYALAYLARKATICMIHGLEGLTGAVAL